MLSPEGVPKVGAGGGADRRPRELTQPAKSVSRGGNSSKGGGGEERKGQWNCGGHVLFLNRVFSWRPREKGVSEARKGTN